MSLLHAVCETAMSQQLNCMFRANRFVVFDHAASESATYSSGLQAQGGTHFQVKQCGEEPNKGSILLLSR